MVHLLLKKTGTATAGETVSRWMGEKRWPARRAAMVAEREAVR